MNKPIVGICTLLVLVLSGCSRHTLKTEMPVEPVQFTQATLAQMVGEARTGDLLQFKQNGFLGTHAVMVGRDYTAASGKRCRTILNETGESLNRIICRTDQTQWNLVKPLITPLARKQGRAQNAKAQTAKEHTVSSRRFVIRQGETLLMFSRRTTGQAHNWREIARFNRIANADKIAAGMQLAIPPGLPLSGQ
ncbi:MAG: hypothetical protein KTR32_18165 [Granulosicoccus sp.]|nr:hypothetical protein [Granulosicoccus sp.]